MTDTTKPNGDRDRQDLGLQYHVLPDDPLAALNILRVISRFFACQFLSLIPGSSTGKT
jgi:hypothetical protein